MCFLTTEYYYFKNKILTKDLVRFDSFDLIIFENGNTFNFNEQSTNLFFVNLCFGSISNISFKLNGIFFKEIDSIIISTKDGTNTFNELSVLIFESLKTGYTKYCVNYDRIY